MKMTLIGAAALVATIAMPAFAGNEFYLVQDRATKKCSVVEKEPTINRIKIVGAVHQTMVQAEAAMKADKSCVAL